MSDYSFVSRPFCESRGSLGSQELEPLNLTGRTRTPKLLVSHRDYWDSRSFFRVSIPFVFLGSNPTDR
jgi:hypothetical protein